MQKQDMAILNIYPMHRVLPLWSSNRSVL